MATSLEKPIPRWESITAAAVTLRTPMRELLAMCTTKKLEWRYDGEGPDATLMIHITESTPTRANTVPPQERQRESKEALKEIADTRRELALTEGGLYMPIAEAAVELGRTAETLKNWIRDGKLTGKQGDGKRWVVLRAEIEKRVAGTQSLESIMTAAESQDEVQYRERRMQEFKEQFGEPRSEFYISEVLEDEILIRRLRKALRGMTNAKTQADMNRAVSDAQKRYDANMKSLNMQIVQKPASEKQAEHTLHQILREALKMDAEPEVPDEPIPNRERMPETASMDKTELEAANRKMEEQKDARSE